MKWYMASLSESRGDTMVRPVTEIELETTLFELAAQTILDVGDEDKKSWLKQVEEFSDFENQVVANDETVWAFSSRSQNDARRRLYEYMANAYSPE